MKTIYINSLLTILTFFGAILQVSGKIHDGRFKWINGFTKQGRFLIFLLIASVAINFWKDYQTEKDNNIKEDSLKIRKVKEDSILNYSDNERNLKIITALAKYGLKYDSAEKIIRRLVKDSSKKEIKINYGNHPELDICQIRQEKAVNDSIKILINFCVTNASAYHININEFILEQGNDEVLRYIKRLDNNLIKDLQLSTLTKYDAPVATFGSNIEKNVILYFIFKGTYSDRDNKVFQFKRFCTYNIDKKEFGNPVEPTYSKILKFYRKNGIRY